MKHVVLIGSDPVTAADVRDCLTGKYELTIYDSVDDLLNMADSDLDICMVIIDTPSKVAGTSDLIAHINFNNFSVFNIGMMILTSEETADKDIRFLGGPVSDVVYKPFNGKVFLNRFENTVKIFESVSFDEFAKMLKALPANIYLKDSTGRYVFSSQTWHHLDTGNDPNWTIRGKTDLDIRKDQDNARLAMQSDLKIIKTGKGMSYIIEENEDGIQEYLHLIKEPLFNEDGRIRGIIALINNVTEQEKMRNKLEELSVKDSLTGLYNRSYYEEYVSKFISEMQYPVSIISADCDDLKMINDTYGHPVGDSYIKLGAKLLRDHLPPSSKLFRTGGDEFVAIVPDCSSNEAEYLVEEIRLGASDYKISGNELSVSVGSATIDDSGADILAVIRQADDNMYYDKKSKKRKMK